MSRSYSYINTAKVIISLYNGEIPFGAFLKDFFSKEKKYGSNDRRNISSLCYNYFRTGNAITNKTIEERLLTGLFLCNNSLNEILQNEKPEWGEKVTLPLDEKLIISNTDIEKIFSFNKELSEGIDAKLFNTSFLTQPRLFARVRPGKKQAVKQKLEAAQIFFEEIDQSCLAFANGTKLEEVADINRELVIQDFNSQRTGELMIAASSLRPLNVWDCCAASGGKSIMAYDLLPGIKLTVSDIRQSIIQNLHKRLRDAGIRNYQSFIADLSDDKDVKTVLQDKSFDFIICDAPCSGSGTWSRTPEQLMFFHQDGIARYSQLQKNICTNTIPFLKEGGYFLYITCSVFKEENEKIADFIQKMFSLKLLKKQLLKGYEVKADTMFAALFQLT